MTEHPQELDSDLAVLTIKRDNDVVRVRQQAHNLARLLGYSRQDQTQIATATSEVARNALIHGGGGGARFSLETDCGHQFFVVEILDHGPGIANLEDVLNGRLKPEALGLIAAHRLMDRLEIDRPAAGGTRVQLRKRLPRDEAVFITDLRVHLARLSQEPSDDPDMQIQHLNRELSVSLEELRSRQEELERLNIELEDTNRGVVALYSELDEKAEQLKRASELKSRFLSNMGHEFRTPLNSILALSALLLEGVDGTLASEQSRQVMYIRQSAEGLTELVNDLLDLAKVESGNVDVRPRNFLVHELFGGLRGMLKPLLFNDQVTLSFDEPADLPVLRTDMGKLSQILRNFISNALKFTDRGEVRVSAYMSADGRRIAFEVRDTGIGIAPEHHQAVFDEFIQVENPLQARHKGTGLGLALSKKLAELLGGEVGLQSTLGQGSTFSVSIPPTYGMTSALADTAPGDGLSGQGMTPVAPAVDSKSILIIDDEEAFRYVLRQLLSDSRLIILEANDGVAGLDLMRSRRPDAIFLDLQMPKMDGYHVLREIAADPQLAVIPVVVCTSSILGVADEARLAPAASILPKNLLSRDAVRTVLRQLHLNDGRV